MSANKEKFFEISKTMFPDHPGGVQLWPRGDHRSQKLVKKAEFYFFSQSLQIHRGVVFLSTVEGFGKKN